MVHMNENNVFVVEHSSRPPHPNNCPPGHFISMAHGGKGHWDGDGCCDKSSGVTNSIDMGIAGLLFLATILIIFTKSFKFLSSSKN